jgi:hypothetical protein
MTTSCAGTNGSSAQLRVHAVRKSLSEPPRDDRTGHTARDRRVLTAETLGDLPPERPFKLAPGRRPARRPHRGPPRPRRPHACGFRRRGAVPLTASAVRRIALPGTWHLAPTPSRPVALTAGESPDLSRPRSRTTHDLAIRLLAPSAPRLRPQRDRHDTSRPQGR